MNYLTPLTAHVDERAKGALDALRAAGREAALISDGIWALADRPAEDVRTTIVRTSPAEIVLVAASEHGYQDGSQKVELQLPLSEDAATRDENGYRLPEPSLFVSEHDGENLRQYQVARPLAVWAMRAVAHHIGEYEACMAGLVDSFDVDYHVEGDLRDALDDDHGLFVGLGLYALAKDITRATQVRERFAPAPKGKPLLLGRDRPWSPAEYTIPDGKVVEDVLNVPIDAVFTAVWDNVGGDDVVDGSEGRGVSPYLRFLHTAHAEASGDISTAAPDTDRRRTTTSIWRPWAPTRVEDRALYAARYVIHTGDGPNLRELGGSRNQWGAISVSKTADGRYRSNSVVIPKLTDGGYAGPLPGNPRRRLRWDDDEDGTTAVFTALVDGKWVDGDSVRIADTADPADVDQVINALLVKAGLCWADIDTEPEDQDEEDQADEGAEPTKYFNEEGEEIPEWEAQLLAQTEDE